MKQQLASILATCSDLTIDTVVYILTSPYYRFYDANTRRALHSIARIKNERLGGPALQQSIATWRARKEKELQFTSAACALTAAAFVSGFSWQDIQTAHWLVRASWSLGLVLSILGVVLSAQQIAVFHTLGGIDVHSEEFRHSDESVAAKKAVIDERIERHVGLLITRARRRTGLADEGWAPKRSMLFMWQAAIMFMAYSVCLFLFGFTFYMITPLINGDRWEDEWVGWDVKVSTGRIADFEQVAIIYLVGTAIVLLLYAICTFLAHRHSSL